MTAAAGGHRVARAVSRVLGALLLIEALVNVSWIVGLLPSLGVRGVLVDGLIGLRGVVTAAEVAAGWRLMTGGPSARVLARVVLIASAAMMTMETGFRLTPSNLDPTFHWWMVGLYWIYAAAWLWWLRRAPDPVTPSSESVFR